MGVSLHVSAKAVNHPAFGRGARRLKRLHGSYPYGFENGYLSISGAVFVISAHTGSCSRIDAKDVPSLREIVKDELRDGPERHRGYTRMAYEFLVACERANAGFEIA